MITYCAYYGHTTIGDLLSPDLQPAIW